MRAELKKILRFYYSAESLNRALDNIIEHTARNSWKDACDACASMERVGAVVQVKGELSDYWARLNGVISSLSEKDADSLKEYARLRTGVAKLPSDKRRELHRALVKFSRRASNILKRNLRAYRCVCAYYALLSPTED